MAAAAAALIPLRVQVRHPHRRARDRCEAAATCEACRPSREHCTATAMGGGGCGEQAPHVSGRVCVESQASTAQ